MAVIEIGAGTAIPTVRYKCEAVAGDRGVPLIRINLEERGDPDNILIPMGGLEALQEIVKHL